MIVNYTHAMNRQEIIDTIRSHRPALSAMGVARLSLFGSTARDAIRPDSDVDVIVDTVDGEAFGLLKLAGISRTLEAALGRKIDVFSRCGLNNAPKMKERISRDLIDVF